MLDPFPGRTRPRCLHIERDSDRCGLIRTGGCPPLRPHKSSRGGHLRSRKRRGGRCVGFRIGYHRTFRRFLLDASAPTASYGQLRTRASHGLGPAIMRGRRHRQAIDRSYGRRPLQQRRCGGVWPGDLAGTCVERENASVRISGSNPVLAVHDLDRSGAWVRADFGDGGAWSILTLAAASTVGRAGVGFRGVLLPLSARRHRWC
jgi:hypothetical protein